MVPVICKRYIKKGKADIISVLKSLSAKSSVLSIPVGKSDLIWVLNHLSYCLNIYQLLDCQKPSQHVFSDLETMSQSVTSCPDVYAVN